VVFKDDAELDTSEVEDVRGSTGRIKSVSVGGGGLGLIVTIVILLINSGVLGGGSNSLGSLSGLDNTSVSGMQADNSQVSSSCKTGADANANAREDCRIVGYVNSIQKYWRSEFERNGKSYEIAKLAS